MNSVDLHTHSTKSDGTYTPSDLIDYAVKKGLSAIALTDHDSTEGIPEALKRGLYHKEHGYDIEVIPGIEFSSEYLGQDVHIVGLYIDYTGEYFQDRIAHFVESRNRRNRAMCERFKANGMDISYEELIKEYPDRVITRAHYADMLMKKGYVKSKKEAFDRYIGDHRPFHIPRKKMSPFRAVEIIRKAGGFPILAHPVLYGFSKEVLEKLVSELKEAGLMGIEAIYSTYTLSDERDIRALASKYDLCLSGGSDFHGSNKPDIDLATGKGHLFVPDEVLSDIKSAFNKMLKNNENYTLKKLLLTDLDGTLLRDDKTISSYTFETLKKWTEAGHCLALCSGRDITSVNKVLSDLGLSNLNNVYTIGFNGGLIYDYHKQKTIYRTGLPIDKVRYLQSEAKKAGIYMQTYQDDYYVIPRLSEEPLYYQRVIKTRYVISEDITEPLSFSPCKCLLIELNNLDKLDSFVRSIKPWATENNISIMYSNPNYVEIIPSESGKGSACVKLKEYLNIPGLLTVGAGDEQNDKSLLSACDVGIAMSNGIDELKNMVSTISEDDCNHDGLAKTIIGMI